MHAYTPEQNRDAPRHVETEKTCYQSRYVISPHDAKTSVSFNSVTEGAQRALANATIMPYTDINGRLPNSVERGHASHQGSMGRGDVDLRPSHGGFKF